MRALFSLLLLALASAAGAQTPLVRCVSADGKVTYTNDTCPTGTKLEREVRQPDPVDPADARRARERARDDAQRVEQIEREREREAEQAAKARAAAQKQAESRRAECRKLQQRVLDAEADLDKSTLAKRASIEQRLRTAREAYAKECMA